MDPKKAERLKNKYQKSNPESGNSPLKKTGVWQRSAFSGYAERQTEKYQENN
jgi:hypothetical protein